MNNINESSNNQESVSGFDGVDRSRTIYARETPENSLSQTASHFVTIAIPASRAWKIKRQELDAFGRLKMVETPKAYGDICTDTQYKWLRHMLGKCRLEQILDKWYFWFEITKAENVHIHALIKTKNKKHFEFKSRVYDTFELPKTRFPRFMDIKEFDKTRWNDYDIKYNEEKKKTMSSYKPYKNTEIRVETEAETIVLPLCGSADRKCQAPTARPAKERESNASHPVGGKEIPLGISVEIIKQLTITL